MFSHIYQGGDTGVEILTASGKAPGKEWKQQGIIHRVYDKHIKGFIFLVEKGMNTILQCPIESSDTLGLVQQYLVFQVRGSFNKPLSIEIVILDNRSQRRRLHFSTRFREIVCHDLHVQIPLYYGNLEKWNNLVFDLKALCSSLFPSLRFTSIDTISISPVCRLRKVFTIPFVDHILLTIPELFQFPTGTEYKTQLFRLDYSPDEQEDPLDHLAPPREMGVIGTGITASSRGGESKSKAVKGKVTTTAKPPIKAAQTAGKSQSKQTTSKQPNNPQSTAGIHRAEIRKKIASEHRSEQQPTGIYNPNAYEILPETNNHPDVYESLPEPEPEPVFIRSPRPVPVVPRLELEPNRKVGAEERKNPVLRIEIPSDNKDDDSEETPSKDGGGDHDDDDDGDGGSEEKDSSGSGSEKEAEEEGKHQHSDSDEEGDDSDGDSDDIYDRSGGNRKMEGRGEGKEREGRYPVAVVDKRGGIIDVIDDNYDDDAKGENGDRNRTSDDDGDGDDRFERISKGNSNLPEPHRRLRRASPAPGPAVRLVSTVSSTGSERYFGEAVQGVEGKEREEEGKTHQDQSNHDHDHLQQLDQAPGPAAGSGGSGVGRLAGSVLQRAAQRRKLLEAAERRRGSEVDRSTEGEGEGEREAAMRGGDGVGREPPAPLQIILPAPSPRSLLIPSDRTTPATDKPILTLNRTPRTSTGSETLATTDVFVDNSDKLSTPMSLRVSQSSRRGLIVNSPESFLRQRSSPLPGPATAPRTTADSFSARGTTATPTAEEGLGWGKGFPSSLIRVSSTGSRDTEEVYTSRNGTGKGRESPLTGTPKQSQRSHIPPSPFLSKQPAWSSTASTGVDTDPHNQSSSTRYLPETPTSRSQVGSSRERILEHQHAGVEALPRPPSRQQPPLPLPLSLSWGLAEVQGARLERDTDDTVNEQIDITAKGTRTPSKSLYSSNSRAFAESPKHPNVSREQTAGLIHSNNAENTGHSADYFDSSLRSRNKISGDRGSQTKNPLGSRNLLLGDDLTDGSQLVVIEELNENLAFVKNELSRLEQEFLVQFGPTEFERLFSSLTKELEYHCSPIYVMR